ncbi:MAG TPA: lysylphosphatidylglycerol synthase transmembrane domain-containing protein [Solirubrobacteraceae bacterium]|nr:lysylphosphatidylglycerol synthase transmembrane domain-containing protein [Solirubrobacteraceae bacterium]
MADEPQTPLRLDSTAPVREDNPRADAEDDADEEMPRMVLTRRTMLALGLFVVSAVAFLYFVLPKIAGLDETWDRVRHGAPGWLLLAAGLELLSFGGYVMLFRTVFVRPGGGGKPIGWRVSYEITMAGVAATRLFAAAGAGGIALTAWALRRSGMERRIVACRMVAFLVILYAVYMAALVICGLGLRFKILEGSSPFPLTVLPAMLAGGVIVAMLLMTLVPGDFERRLVGWAGYGGRRARWLRRAAGVPASVASGVRTAIAILRSGDPRLLGAIAWWGFDIGVLWASFHAFGPAPPTAVLVMGYFVGMVANTLPLPGGVGAVDGGLIGCFIAFGVDSGLAVVAVLVYRAFAFWLPTLPGAIAYLQLRRRVGRWREPSVSPGVATV